MMQVRALLDARWYYLKHSDGGSNSMVAPGHLPIAALAPLAPFVAIHRREIAAATALLPMLAAMMAIALIARRLVAPPAFLIGIAFLACGGSVTGMWQPLRIDHHGWQLAFLAWAAAALTDPRPARAGITLGAATALSFAIGMEMLLYLAAAGAVVALAWVRDGEPKRLFCYGVALAGGCALAFLLFTSEANRLPVCDALSPVWLSAMVAAGAVAMILAWASPKDGPAARRRRPGGRRHRRRFAWAWPDCLGRLERLLAELSGCGSQVREAMRSGGTVGRRDPDPDPPGRGDDRLGGDCCM